MKNTKEMTMEEIRKLIDNGRLEKIDPEELNMYYENMRAREEYKSDIITLLYVIANIEYADLYG